MGKVAEREAQRRERQRRLRIARLQETFLGYLVVPGVLLTAAMVVGTVYGVWKFLRVSETLGLIVSVIAGMLAVLFGWLTLSCCRHLTTLKHRVEQLSYAPPSEKGPLPPAEVLLRGAGQPGGQPAETLLRAATPHETPQEDLLRATEE